MKFLPAGERVEMALHKSKTTGRREKRHVVMEFAMVLDGQKISGISTFIADAWKGMKRPTSGQCLVELERGVESQTIRFYPLPKGEYGPQTNEVVLTMEATDLGMLRLEKHKSGQIALFFQVMQPIGKDLWDWLFHSEQSATLYAEFEECQTELLKDEPKAMTARVQ
jgi:hypothetical protein